MNLERPLAPEPYEMLPQVPSFTLTSPTLVDGQPMPYAQLADGDNSSPELHWSSFPAETKSFIVTCFDPDAPTPSGFWHWTIVDIDASVTSLPAGAGQSDLFLDGAAAHVKNDASTYAYYGAAPPAGDRPHRYIFAVHALDVETLDLDPQEVTPAVVAFSSLGHTLARATLTVTHQN
ncbi:MAG: YbhB/YbcL family Raf kinase inhibitor-like protein [Actinomycetaceae bacterium]|nr:YbhB/YbcL family Raf kinase inhibitor-like protein [Actinomycetaceae bacterium]